MVKNFIKGGRYTLLLVHNINDEIVTYTVNVTFTTRIGDVLEFVNNDGVYTVDIEFMQTVVTVEELIIEKNFDTGLDEFDIVERQYFRVCANIIKGWQY